MGNILAGFINIILGILFHLCCILALIGTIYLYLKMLPRISDVITGLEIAANANPIAKIIILLIKISQFLIIPAIIIGMSYYVLYAQQVVK